MKKKNPRNSQDIFVLRSKPIADSFCEAPPKRKTLSSSEFSVLRGIRLAGHHCNAQSRNAWCPPNILDYNPHLPLSGTAVIVQNIWKTPSWERLQHKFCALMNARDLIPNLLTMQYLCNTANIMPTDINPSIENYFKMFM
ncbi:Hypothetical predicted protein [Podarcis lilfordi]|uniref:Uncharacterized protein n=1 Tax=Podarcis lilfordi TaxID=74358 RepID=A0AA35PQ07_9SAUR|nr:Hypothetical predicted protein [Podarcis lilfordi]